MPATFSDYYEPDEQHSAWGSERSVEPDVDDIRFYQLYLTHSFWFWKILAMCLGWFFAPEQWSVRITATAFTTTPTTALPRLAFYRAACFAANRRVLRCRTGT